MVNKHKISTFLAALLIFLSCQPAEKSTRTSTQEMLLECLVRTATNSDKAFDPQLHYLAIIQENRSDLDYHTVSLQNLELSNEVGPYEYYQSVLDGTVIRFFYMENLGDKVENRPLDEFIVRNGMTWEHVIPKAKKKYKTNLSTKIYDPRINVNLLYDVFNGCVLDTIIFSSLNLDSLIRNNCELCTN